MQSNDARTLLSCAVPTAVAGVVAVAVSSVLAGGKGAIGAGFGTFVAMVVMASGLIVLERTAKHLPHLFQAMGMLLFITEFLLVAVVLAVFQNTTLFNVKAFALALLAATLVWVGAQTRAHMKAKILYVDPEAEDERKARGGEEVRSRRVRAVRSRAGIRACALTCYRPVPSEAQRAQVAELPESTGWSRRPMQLMPDIPLGHAPISRPHIRKTSPVPFRGRAPRRHNEVAVPMRHAEGARGEF